MLLRSEATRTEEEVSKVPGRNMCVPSAFHNVCTVRAQAVVRLLERAGPYSYHMLNQTLVTNRAHQHLRSAGLDDLVASAPGAAFLIHTDDYCAALRKEDEGMLTVCDPSYPNRVRVEVAQLGHLIGQYQADNPTTEIGFYALHSGRYQPGPVPPSFFFSAGGDRDARPRNTPSAHHRGSKLLRSIDWLCAAPCLS